MRYLDKTLYEYGRTDFYPFHMPGHKRQMEAGYLGNPYAVDITEITDFDNLHHAEGILKENQNFAAELYGAARTWFLVNGSTAGILAAVSASTRRFGKILMARNCHKAAYHAAYLGGLETVYLYPSYEPDCGLNGGISLENVEKALEENEDIQAVLITSPSYDGMVSDIAAIADAAHKHGIPLIVDEAHGAHFKFHEYFPVSALDLGADLVIQSLHKTLPSFTQTAVIHVQGKRVPVEKLEQFLGIYQTSSPSYVLMGGISSCLRFLQEQGDEKFREFTENLEECRNYLKKLKVLRLIGEELTGQNGVFAVDRSKIVVSTAWSPINGPKLHEILRKRYHLELEMEAEQYVLALTSVMDTREGFKRLVHALTEIDGELENRLQEEAGKSDCFDGCHFVDSEQISGARQVMPIWKGMEQEREEILLAESEGRISAEYAYLYPPGIPVLVPGERIGRDFLEQAERWKKQGIFLQGPADYTQERIQVVKE